jgi:membrane associated rhomboid family serine protease
MIPLHDDNPTKKKPIVTLAVILVCVSVFIWEVSLTGQAQQLIIAYSFIPSTLFGLSSLPAEVAVIPPIATLFTSMFLHGGLMHLVGNMLYLWIFGNNVEDVMGHLRFTFFYLICGLIAALAHALPNTASDIPTLGASGAISGVLGAYLLLYPHARVMVLIPLGFFIRIVYLPAGLVLGFWFVLQIINSAAASGLTGGGVAWGAHIGGFVAGMFLIPFFKNKNVRLFNPGHGQRERKN